MHLSENSVCMFIVFVILAIICNEISSLQTFYPFIKLFAINSKLIGLQPSVLISPKSIELWRLSLRDFEFYRDKIGMKE